MADAVKDVFPARFEKLAPREREIATLSCEGMTSAEIAERLGIKSASVRTTLHRVYAKLDISGLQELRSLADLEPSLACDDSVTDVLKCSDAPLLYEVSRSLVGMLAMFLFALLLALPNAASPGQSTLVERVVGLAAAIAACAVLWSISRRAHVIVSRIGFLLLSVLGDAAALLALGSNCSPVVIRLLPLERAAIDATAFFLLAIMMPLCFGWATTARKRTVGLLRAWVCAIAARAVVLSGGALFISVILGIFSFAASLLVIGSWRNSEREESPKAKKADRGYRVVAMGFLLGAVSGTFLLSVADNVAKLPVEVEALLILFILFGPLRRCSHPIKNAKSVFRSLLPVILVMTFLVIGGVPAAVMTFFLVAYYFGMNESQLLEMLVAVSVGLAASVMLAFFDDWLFRRSLFETYLVLIFTMISASEVGLLVITWLVRRDAEGDKAAVPPELAGNDLLLEKMDAFMVVAGCTAFQRDVVLSTAHGETARSIGERTGYSTATVKTTRAKAYKKLDVNNIEDFMKEVAGTTAV